MRWFCETCGIVAVADPTHVREADSILPLGPICRHNIGLSVGPPVGRMVELPEWHPEYGESDGEDDLAA